MVHPRPVDLVEPRAGCGWRCQACRVGRWCKYDGCERAIHLDATAGDATPCRCHSVQHPRGVAVCPCFRRRRPGWHRAAGNVLVVCGLVTALTGLWMAQFYPWPEGDGEILYLLRIMFGSAMAVAIVLAVEAIRRRDFPAHGAWMIRSYTIGMGAGTQVLTHIPYFVLVGKPGELSKAVLMGAGWVINIAVAEWTIRRQTSGLRTSPRRC